MTESEWLACADPRPMLEFLRGKASDRKLRLFCSACCRQVWDLLRDERTRRGVGAAECLADGAMAKKARVRTVNAAAVASHEYTGACRAARAAANTAVYALDLTMPPYSFDTVLLIADTERDKQDQMRLLRDVFGNPFRPSPPLPPSVLAWNDGTVPRIAQAIYEERKMPEGTLDTARLAILADALLDAGCEDEALIQHCRQPGPHVRGCWAVDLILGKQ